MRFSVRAIAASIGAIVLLALAPFASAQEKVSLRLDWVNSGYHAIWYYAIDKGIFKAEGIDLEVLEGRGSAVTAQTVGNNSVMFGTADTGAVMGLIAQGLPVRVVGGYLRQNPMAIIYPKKNGWKGWSDMAKARVGWSPGGASGLLLAPVLKATGMEGKLQLISMEPAAKPTSLLEGKVDAIESFDFLQVPLFEANGLEVATLTYASAGINVPGLSLITSRDTIQKNPALVRKIVGLMEKAQVAARADPNGAIDSLMKRAPTLKRDVVTRVLTLSFNLFEPGYAKGKPLGWMSPEEMVKAQDILIQYGGIKTKQPIETYFTNEFVPGS